MTLGGIDNHIKARSGGLMSRIVIIAAASFVLAVAAVATATAGGGF